MLVACASDEEPSDASRIVYPQDDARIESGVDDARIGTDASRTEDAEVDADLAPTPTCSDGVRNQDETGIDCGGTTCRACAHCDTCDAEDGCPDALACIAGRCVHRREVTVNWLENCVVKDSGDLGAAVLLSGMPAGTLELTALSGGGTPWSVGVHDPPTRGYAYRVTCDPLDTSALATPEGVYYATPEQAFAALAVTSIQVAHAGGDIRCYQADSSCADNSGSIVMSIQSVCADN